MFEPKRNRLMAVELKWSILKHSSFKRKEVQNVLFPFGFRVTPPKASDLGAV